MKNDFMKPHLFYLVEAIQTPPEDDYMAQDDEYTHWPVRICLTAEEAEQTRKTCQKQWRAFASKLQPLYKASDNAERQYRTTLFQSAPAKTALDKAGKTLKRVKLQHRANMLDKLFDNPSEYSLYPVKYNVVVVSDDPFETATHHVRSREAH